MYFFSLIIYFLFDSVYGDNLICIPGQSSPPDYCRKQLVKFFAEDFLDSIRQVKFYYEQDNIIDVQALLLQLPELHYYTDVSLHQRVAAPKTNQAAWAQYLKDCQRVGLTVNMTVYLNCHNFHAYNVMLINDDTVIKFTYYFNSMSYVVKLHDEIEYANYLKVFLERFESKRFSKIFKKWSLSCLFFPSLPECQKC